MKTEKHTAGPWKVRYQHDLGGKLTVVAGDRDNMDTIVTVEWIANRTQQKANANLIALAPRMAEALTQLRNGMMANDKQMTDEERSPTGDDYNVLFDLVLDAMKVLSEIKQAPQPQGGTMSYHVLDHKSGMYVWPDNFLNAEEPFAYPERDYAVTAIRQVMEANNLQTADDFEIIDQEDE